MSPRRWTPNIRIWAYRYLALRDGEQCAICHALPTTKKAKPITNKLTRESDYRKPQNSRTTPNRETELDYQNSKRSTNRFTRKPDYTQRPDHTAFDYQKSE